MAEVVAGRARSVDQEAPLLPGSTGRPESRGAAGPVATTAAGCYPGVVPASPGPIAPVHRLTIATALVGALAYLAWELNQTFRGDDAWAAVRAVVALVVTIGIGLYLRSLRGLADKLTPRDPPGRRSRV